jgi:hypothetical protein
MNLPKHLQHELGQCCWHQADSAQRLHEESRRIAEINRTPAHELTDMKLAGMGRSIAATLTPAEMRALAKCLEGEACLREAMDRSGK